MNELPVRIVKVGCSLFERPQLPEQLIHWLRAQPPAIQILIAGGGELADSIRSWDDRFQLGEARSHWLCIEALSITAQVLQHALRDFPLLRNYHELMTSVAKSQQRQEPTIVLFDVLHFLRDIEPSAPPLPLPHTWQVTTDSIAARLAEVSAADELVLLKSRRCPEEQTDFAALAEQGYVDRYFPLIGPQLKHVALCRL